MNPLYPIQNNRTILAAPLVLISMLVVFSFSLFFSSSSRSQEQKAAEDDQRWYKVEMIIFRQGGNPREQVEQWSTDITLTYPIEWTTLVEQKEDSTLADPGSLILLPSSELTLQDQAKKLQRSNNYRVLFHGAWNQGMTERVEGPSILIEGGELFGDHRELEGSIHLKLQRYLHITANLWLTDFATNFGQEQLLWPEIPMPPNKPQKRFSLLSEDRSGNVWSQLDTNNGYDSRATQPYIIENIAPIKATRRMRSKELHYIDHPLAGILIQFTPIGATDDETELLDN